MLGRLPSFILHRPCLALKEEMCIRDRPYSLVDYTTDMNMRLAGGEELAIIYTGPINTAVTHGYLVNLDEYRDNEMCIRDRFYTGPSGRHAVFDLVELVRDSESTLYEETGWRLELEQPYKMTHTGKRVVYL